MENNLIEKAKSIVDSLPDVVLDNIIDTKKVTREKAARIILGDLDFSMEEGQELLKNIVGYMSTLGYTDSAISLLAVLISKGHFININTIDSLYDDAINDINYSIEDGDDDFLDSITNQLDILFSSGNKSHLYKDNLEYVLLIGKDLERKKDYYKAIELYDDLIGKGEPIGYLKSALVYKKLGLLDFAVSLLENAYTIYKDNIFLENIIIFYCESGNINLAKKYYSKLYTFNKPNKEILPFFVYSGIIENDDDLKKYELMMLNYIDHNQLIPSIALKKISIGVYDYINSNLESIKNDLKKYSSLNLQSLSKQQHLDFSNLYKRKLFLSQIGVTVLKDEIFLDEHVSDLDYLCFGGNYRNFEILGDYFDENLSLLIKGDLNKKENDKKGDSNKEDSYDTYEKLSMYLANLSMIHFHGLNYRVLEKLFLLLEKGYREIGDIDEHEIPTSLTIVKNEADYIDNFSFDLISAYKNLLKEVDDLYGKYIRVVLQRIARDTQGYKTENDYPKVLFENPKLALFFFVEKLVSQNFPDIDYGDFSKFILKYDLESNSVGDLVLFSMLLHDKSYDNLIDFVMNNDDLMINAISIYYLLESIINGGVTDTKDYDEHCIERFDSKGFLDYMYTFLLKREKEDITDIEKGYIKLCLANLDIISKKDTKLVMDNFIAAEKLNSIEATMQLGNIFEDNGYFDEAISKFQDAFNANPNINTLSKLISTLLNNGDFDRALSFINLGLSHKYEMSYYLFSYHLHKNNFKQAFNGFIEVINKGLPLIDVPVGTNKKLVDVCNRIITLDGEISVNTLELKVLSVFIVHKMDIIFGVGEERQVLNKYFISLFNILGSVPLSNLPDFVNNSIYKFCNNDIELLESGVDMGVTNLEEAFIVIDFYSKKIEDYLLNSSKAIEDLDELSVLHNYINDFNYVVYKFFSQIQGAEKFAYEWRLKIYFTPVKDKITLDEEDFGSKLIN